MVSVCIQNPTCVHVCFEYHWVGGSTNTYARWQLTFSQSAWLFHNIFTRILRKNCRERDNRKEPGVLSQVSSLGVFLFTVSRRCHFYRSLDEIIRGRKRNLASVDITLASSMSCIRTEVLASVTWADTRQSRSHLGPDLLTSSSQASVYLTKQSRGLRLVPAGRVWAAL